MLVRSVTKHILFICEGTRTEPRLLESFERFYFQEGGHSPIVATFGMEAKFGRVLGLMGECEL